MIRISLLVLGVVVIAVSTPALAREPCKVSHWMTGDLAALRWLPPLFDYETKLTHRPADGSAVGQAIVVDAEHRAQILRGPARSTTRTIDEATLEGLVKQYPHTGSAAEAVIGLAMLQASAPFGAAYLAYEYFIDAERERIVANIRKNDKLEQFEELADASGEQLIRSLSVVTSDDRRIPLVVAKCPLNT